MQGHRNPEMHQTIEERIEKVNAFYTKSLEKLAESRSPPSAALFLGPKNPGFFAQAFDSASKGPRRHSGDLHGLNETQTASFDKISKTFEGQEEKRRRSQFYQNGRLNGLHNYIGDVKGIKMTQNLSGQSHFGPIAEGITSHAQPQFQPQAMGQNRFEDPRLAELIFLLKENIEETKKLRAPDQSFVSFSPVKSNHFFPQQASSSSFGSKVEEGSISSGEPRGFTEKAALHMSSKRDSNEISLFETKREETIKEQQQAENSSSEPEILNKDCAGEIFNLEIRLEQLKLEHSRVSEAHESMRKSLIEKQEAIRHEERTTEEDKTNLRSSHFQFTKGKGEYESLVEQHKQLTEENKNLSGLLAKRKEEVEEYEKSAGDLTQKAAILKKQGESLGQELENRMKILGGLNQEFAEASNVYSNFITKMDALKTELELNHTKIRVLEQYLMKHPKLMEKGKKEIPGLNFNL